MGTDNIQRDHRAAFSHTCAVQTHTGSHNRTHVESEPPADPSHGCHTEESQQKKKSSILGQTSLEQQTLPRPLLHGCFLKTNPLPKITFSGPLQEPIGISCTDLFPQIYHKRNEQYHDFFVALKQISTYNPEVTVMSSGVISVWVWSLCERRLTGGEDFMKDADEVAS